MSNGNECSGAGVCDCVGGVGGGGVRGCTELIDVKAVLGDVAPVELIAVGCGWMEPNGSGSLENVNRSSIIGEEHR